MKEELVVLVDRVRTRDSIVCDMLDSGCMGLLRLVGVILNVLARRGCGC